eukprot:SAG22_NODE_4047_length_1407_cov_7.317278_1_plen_213_part_10
MQWRAQLFRQLFAGSELVAQHSARTEQLLGTRREARRRWVDRWEGKKAAMLAPNAVAPTFKSLRAGGATLCRCPIKQEAATMAYTAESGVHHVGGGGGPDDQWGKGDTSSWRPPHPWRSATTWRPDVGISAAAAAARDAGDADAPEEEEEPATTLAALSGGASDDTPAAAAAAASGQGRRLRRRTSAASSGGGGAGSDDDDDDVDEADLAGLR